MHFLALVISDEKPTEASLQGWLSPFIPKKLDWWALGGRYTGLLDPFDLTDTITGGPNCPDVELSLASLVEEATGGEVKMQRPGKSGTGVDALQAKNFRSAGGDPCAVLKDGRWFEPSEEAKVGFATISFSERFGLGRNSINHRTACRDG